LTQPALFCSPMHEPVTSTSHCPSAWHTTDASPPLRHVALQRVPTPSPAQLLGQDPPQDRLALGTDEQLVGAAAVVCAAGGRAGELSRALHKNTNLMTTSRDVSRMTLGSTLLLFDRPMLLVLPCRPCLQMFFRTLCCQKSFLCTPPPTHTP
jgi:hypothetical protein